MPDHIPELPVFRRPFALDVNDSLPNRKQIPHRLQPFFGKDGVVAWVVSNVVTQVYDPLMGGQPLIAVGREYRILLAEIDLAMGLQHALECAIPTRYNAFATK